MTRIHVVLTAILALVAAPALVTAPALAADTLTVDRSHSEAGFKIRHLFSNVSGRFGVFEGTIVMDATRPQASSVTFTIDAASIDTDHADRDKHLRSPDFFDVATYPTITFRSQEVRAVARDRYEVSGILTMRGVSKPVTLPVSFLGIGRDPWGSERAGFTTRVTLSRKDFGITWNKALDSGGLLLGDDVAVTVEIEAVKQAAKPAVKTAS